MAASSVVTVAGVRPKVAPGARRSRSSGRSHGDVMDGTRSRGRGRGMMVDGIRGSSSRRGGMLNGVEMLDRGRRGKSLGTSRRGMSSNCSSGGHLHSNSNNRVRPRRVPRIRVLPLLVPFRRGTRLVSYSMVLGASMIVGGTQSTIRWTRPLRPAYRRVMCTSVDDAVGLGTNQTTALRHGVLRDIATFVTSGATRTTSVVFVIVVHVANSELTRRQTLFPPQGRAMRLFLTHLPVPRNRSPTPTETSPSTASTALRRRSRRRGAGECRLRTFLRMRTKPLDTTTAMVTALLVTRGTRVLSIRSSSAGEVTTRPTTLASWLCSRCLYL